MCRCREALIISVVRQCGTSFQIAFDFDGILSKGSLDLPIEFLIPFVDEIDIAVVVMLSPPAEL